MRSLRVSLLTGAMVLGGLSILPGCSQCRDAQQLVPEETLWQASDAGIDYLPMVQAALDGDESAILRLMEIERGFDAAGSLGHRWVLAHLREKYGMDRLSDLADRLSPSQQENIAWLLANEPAL